MAEESPTVVKQLEKAPMAFVDFCKKYWFAGPIIILVFMGIGMAIKPWFADAMTTKGADNATPKTVPGDKLGNFLGKLLRITPPTAVVLGILFGADAAYAACAGSAPCGAHEAMGWLSQAWTYILGALGASGVALGMGITHLSAPDTLDFKTANNGDNISYTPGAATKMSMFQRTTTKNMTAAKRPYVAVNTTVALDTTVEQLSTGTNPIVSQDLARLLEFMEISTPFHGKILDKETGLGPVVDLVINFIGQGFARYGDAPTVTIVVTAGTNDAPITKYFNFPWAGGMLDDESLSTPWLGSLDNMEIACGLAANTALGAVSAGATTTGASVLRGSTSYAISPYWRQSYIPYWRLDKPAAATNGMVFQNFGGTGPSSTKEEDIVHTIGFLSKWAGLPGTMDFSKLTNIVAPDFGLDDVNNIDLLVLARLRTQFEGRIGNYDYATGGNHVHGAANNGAALDKLLFLLLRQPSLNMKIDTMLRFGPKTTLSGRFKFSETRGPGEDAFIVGGFRELSQKKREDQSSATGGLMPVSYAQARHFRGQVLATGGQ